MKLHFEPNLDYQMQAIEAVCDLFRGQEVCRTEFTVTMKAPMPVGGGATFFPEPSPSKCPWAWPSRIWVLVTV